MATTTSATGSNTSFFGGNLLGGFDGLSTSIGLVRTKLDLGLNKERPKLYDPDVASQMIADANKARGLTPDGAKLSKFTGTTYIAAANDPVYNRAPNSQLPNRTDLSATITANRLQRIAA